MVSEFIAFALSPLSYREILGQG